LSCNLRGPPPVAPYSKPRRPKEVLAVVPRGAQVVVGSMEAIREIIVRVLSLAR
jgi:hypothetical protein